MLRPIVRGGTLILLVRQGLPDRLVRHNDHTTEVPSDLVDLADDIIHRHTLRRPYPRWRRSRFLLLYPLFALPSGLPEAIPDAIDEE